MDTFPVDRAAAAVIETAEAHAWADMYAAAPSDWAEEVGVATRWVGGALVLTWAATGRRYFSRAIGLGVLAPATEEALDDILGGYAGAGITMFLLQSQPHCLPAGYDGWLADRGLEPFDAQDRLVRRGDQVPQQTLPYDRRLTVEQVRPETVDAWADFMQRVYRLDTGPWLQEFIGRPGWSQYVALEDVQIVAARGMFVGADGAAWLGMDGPVPGLGTTDYEPDAVLCEVIVRDGVARGARMFVTDIEAPSEGQDTPAYEYFGRLGFSRPYTRTHYRPADVSGTQ